MNGQIPVGQRTCEFTTKRGGVLTLRRVGRSERQRLISAAGAIEGTHGGSMLVVLVTVRAAIVGAQGVIDEGTGDAVPFKAESRWGASLCCDAVVDALEEEDLGRIISLAVHGLPLEAAKNSQGPSATPAAA